MEKKIEQLKAWVEELGQVKERTPFLDVAIGGMRTAIENLGEHVKVPKEPAKKEK